MKAVGSHAHDPNVLFLVRDKLRLSKPLLTLIHWVTAELPLKAEEGQGSSHNGRTPNNCPKTHQPIHQGNILLNVPKPNQPVERVVVGPVGSSKQDQNTTKPR